jgi:hypothetical protein
MQTSMDAAGKGGLVAGFANGTDKALLERACVKLRQDLEAALEVRHLCPQFSQPQEK